MKAHTYYIISGRPPTGGSFPLLAAPLVGDYGLLTSAAYNLTTVPTRFIAVTIKHQQEVVLVPCESTGTIGLISVLGDAAITLNRVLFIYNVF